MLKIISHSNIVNKMCTTKCGRYFQYPTQMAKKVINFSPPYKRIRSAGKFPQTEIWKIITHSKVINEKCSTKCERCFQYPTQMEKRS